MIVLAGGIGSGKSVVARMLRLKGFGVFDCDFEAKLLMHSDPHIIEGIRKIAGEEVYSGSGTLDRGRLASVIFGDKDKREKVNALVHEAVRNRIGEWLKENRANVFVETAIAAESGIADKADAIWLVDADEETRIERVKSRDGRSVDDIRRIMDAQRAEEELLFSSQWNIVKISNNPSDSILAQINLLLNSSPSLSI